jgi:hypothetical protein
MFSPRHRSPEKGFSMTTKSTYTVQPGDTLGSIALKFTGNLSRYVELVMANPQIPTTVVNRQITFLYPLRPGQILYLPLSWTTRVTAPRIEPRVVQYERSRGVGYVRRIGLGDVNSDAAALVAAFNADNGTTVCTGPAPNPAVLAFQQSYNAQATGQKLDEDGKYGPNTATALANVLQASGSTLTAPGDCSNYTAPSAAMSTAADLNTIAAEVAGDFTLCNGKNANVQAFQDAYNAAVPGSTLGVSQDYGFYTAATAAALASSSVTLPSYLTPPAACTNFPNPAGPGSNGATPPTAPPFTPPTTTTPPSTTSTTGTTGTNYTPWIIGAIAVVAGAGALYYVNRHKHTASSSPTLGPSSHPASTPAAHRMLARGGHHVTKAHHALTRHVRSAHRRLTR